MDLTTATPVEVDTALSAIYDRLATPTARLQAARKDHAWAVKTLAAPRTYLTQDDVDKRAASVARLQAECEAILAECDPLDAEFDRRGGWTRAFLVLASNGHIHRSMHCGTCFPTTQYGWLPSLSGHDEAEIVDAAGADACTVCYPSAPVESLSRPRTILHHTEEAAQAARDEKAAKAAAKAASKAAKALHVDLRPYGVTGYDSRLETLAAAKQWLTDSIGWNSNGTHPSYPLAAVEAVAIAVAGKIDSTPDVEMDAARKRYAKRR